MFARRIAPGMGLFLLLALLASGAGASERQFTYAYQSGVLPPGAAELEPWTTFRAGRADYYNRMDNRLEFEMGVTDGLQTSWYLNWSTIAQDTGGARVRTSELTGASTEWKLNLSDPVADALGSALYTEVTGGPSGLEVEGKLILDKRAGDAVVALNVVGEHEWEFGGEETEREVAVELDLGLAYFLSQRVSLGLEVRNHNVIKPGDGWEYSALFGGPTLAWSQERWWMAVTVLPQLAKLKGSEQDAGRHLVLSDHEMVEARVLFGLHL